MKMIKALFQSSLALAVVATSALGGCKLSALELAPPRVIQLSCNGADAAAQAPMVLILDSGRNSVVWANDRSARTGTLKVEATVYRLDFPPVGGQAGLQGVINRYDGTLQLSRPGAAAAGDRSPPRRLSCDAQPVRPKV